jgi:DNA-binding CsgD family transcriptional regulator/tetratricopeptide (TPR) repeat protein
MVVLEREAQLATLAGYAEEARAGQGRLVLVSGEAGIGKSTLLEELELTLPDARWWWGGCDGLFTPRALGPLADIASQAGGDLQRLHTAAAPRDSLFDAVVTALREGVKLTVMVVEDVHWADDATLDMLRFVGRRVRAAPAMVVVTYRDDAIAPDEPLRVTLGDLASQRSTRRVGVGPLSREAVAWLAQDSCFDGDELHELTGGSPFFVTEVLAAGADGVPASARDAVLARAAGLSAPAREVLDCAALLGARIDPPVLRAATKATADLLDQVLDTGILVADEAALRFRHEIGRQAVAAAIATHRAIDLHRSILDALVTNGCDDDVRLTFHADGCGDADLVLKHAPPAAEAAARLGSHRAAVIQYERAVHHSSGADTGTRARLYDALSDELGMVDRWEEAAAARATSIALWRELDVPLRVGDGLRKYGVVMWRLARGDEVARALGEAREVLEPLGPTEELAWLYAVGVEEGDVDAVARTYDRSVEIARDLDKPALLAHALSGVGFIAACRNGDYDSPMREALQISLAHGFQQEAGRSYTNYTEYLHGELRFDDAAPLVREGIRYCDEHDVATYGNCLHGGYARALTDQGRWDDALRHAHVVLESGASPINRLFALIVAGVIAARRGLQDDADRYLTEAQQVSDGVEERAYIAFTRVALAEALWLRGDVDGARAHLTVARGWLTPLESWEAAPVRAWEHRLGVAGDDVPALEPFAVEVEGPPRRAAATWDEHGMPYHAALALGDSDDEADLREAVSRLDGLGAVAAVDVVRRRMRALGLRSVPSGARATTREDPHGLTRREREVLDLVEEGMTNEQIARRLVISTKTVDHHVSAVLAKLGVSSRREAAEAAAAAL